jgi:hypothetical protein
MLSIRGNDYPFQKHHSNYAEHTRNEFHRWLSLRGTHFIAGCAYEQMISSLAEQTRKCLKVEYLGRIEYNFQKPRGTGPWDYKVPVYAKKVKKTFKTHKCFPSPATYAMSKSGTPIVKGEQIKSGGSTHTQEVFLSSLESSSGNFFTVGWPRDGSIK